MMKAPLCALLFLVPLLVFGQAYVDDQNIPGEPASEENVEYPEHTQMGMDGMMGAVSINNQSYTQVRYLPQIRVGKFGFGLDIDLLIDNEGKVRPTDWDEWQDFVNKIYYISYAAKHDPFFFKVGSIPDYTLGHGLIFDHYSNMLLYPEVKNVGGYVGVNTKFAGLGFEGFTHNIHENQILGLRAFASPFTVIKLPLLEKLRVGVNLGVDRNQYAKYPDKDGDHVPDVYDKFPDNVHYSIDTDDDGIADEIDVDLNGNGIVDDPNYNVYVHDNFADIVEHYPNYHFDTDIVPDLATTYNQSEPISIFSMDYEMPLVGKDNFGLSHYAELATIEGAGTGLIFPGFSTRFAIFDAKLEVRNFSDRFLPGYFDRLYDNQRSQVKYLDELSDPEHPGRRWSLTTKEAVLDSVAASVGWFGFLRANIYDALFLKIAYQDTYGGENARGKSLWGSLTLNPTLIKKIKEASFYYSQTNNRYINFVHPRNPNAHLLGKVVYSISENASIIGRYSEVYNDLNNDGLIKGNEEVIECLVFGMEFTF